MTAVDPVFPLYRVRFFYEQGDGKEYVTSLMKPWLYRADPGPEVVERQARERWPGITWHHEPERTRRLVRVEVERKPDVAWVLGWFSHETFRAGRTDAELRDSFERFVSKWEPYQDIDGLQGGAPCLMGAQDRWRWAAFCDCETCVRDDIALIAH